MPRLYLVAFIDQLAQSVQGALNIYVASGFNQHGLSGITDVLATIFGGVCNLAIAKVIDIWGRCEGFLVMIGLILLGMVMKAACINIEMYTAANTIYWVGHIGVQYVISIIYADTTSLQNRMILFGLQQTPIVASVFGGGAIAELFQKHDKIPWAFGAFCIIMTFFAIPVAAVFVYSKHKAQKEGKFPERISGRTTGESIKYYAIEFDVPGMFLTIFGWALLLLPFSLVVYAPNGWKTGYIIAMIVVGAVLLIAFVIWEKFFAPVTYFPFRYLKDRTILGACLLYGLMFLSIFVWDTYYYSYLIVVHDLSVKDASYTLNAFTVSSAIVSPFIGLLISFIGTFKWPSIAISPVAILGTALLIYFRHPGTDVGYLVMCQIFNGVATGFWALTAQLAIMASVSHQEIAVGIALWGLFGSIGAAVGNAIAGGLWTNIVPRELYKNLPENVKNATMEIYGDIEKQTSYPIGSPVRDAIIHTYGYVQRIMVIVGACFLPLCIICLFMWKNINVKQLEKVHGKQTKGNVF